MPDAPLLRATDTTGEIYDDPSEDVLFVFMEDLQSPGASFVVKRVEKGREGEFMRVTRQDNGAYLLEGPGTQGIDGAGSMRAVHESLTRWSGRLEDPRAQSPMCVSGR